jgi:hypothetical protein
MAAELKVYTDAGCTVELTGTLQIGAVTGLNGTDGETVITSVWLKNTGDVTISNLILTETLDTAARGHYSLDGVTYNVTTITVDTLVTGAIQRIYIKVIIPPATAVETDTGLNFTCTGTHL